MREELHVGEPESEAELEAETETFDVIESQRLRGPDAFLTGRLLLMISSAIAIGILVLIGVLLVVALTSGDNRPPSLAELGSIVGNDKAVDAYKQLRTQRFDVIKDLLQLLVVALVVPLLTIVLGYIFGRQKAPRRRRRAS
jgi:uncharacterized membrane protein